jgi:NADH-quinone oxidoreductase subunit G
VFDLLANSIEAFADLNYDKLAESHEQFPIVGRSDMYYGGTTYENTKGLGVQLLPMAQVGGTVRIPKVRKEAALHPKEKEVLAVPVNKLYDFGITVSSASLLEGRIGETKISMNSSTAKKLGVDVNKQVKLSFDGVNGEAIVSIDDSVSAGVVLVPRSMGIAIREPVTAKVK